MRKIRYEFLLIAGLIMTLGCATVFANGHNRIKYPKNNGMLTIKTDRPYNVWINGEDRGPSGVGTPREFFLPEGDGYLVEIKGADGKVLWDADVVIEKYRKRCICLITIKDTVENPCPWYVELRGPTGMVKAGQPVTITAVDTLGYGGELNYDWSVSPERSFTEQGNSIVIDTTGLRGGSIFVSAKVNDGKYPQCDQPLTFTVEIEPEIIKPVVIKCDEFDNPKPDDLKARLDNCTINVQTTPDSKLYIVIYPKAGGRGGSDAEFRRLYKIAAQYLINKKGMDPSRFEIVKGRERANTRWVIWIFPAGADYPPLD